MVSIISNNAVKIIEKYQNIIEFYSWQTLFDIIHLLNFNRVTHNIENYRLRLDLIAKFIIESNFFYHFQ